MLTPEEIRDRANFIGGSDVGIICGLNPYKNKSQLWMEKTGLVEIEDISHKKDIIFGNYMEDGVASWFQDSTGKQLHPKEKIKYIHPKHSWMAANFDRRLVNENAVLECKTAYKPGVDEWGDGENKIPLMYRLQCAHYCEVGGFDKIYLAVVFSSTKEFRWYVYDKHQETQDKIITIESNFWFNHVVANIPPEPSTKDEVLTMYRHLDKEPIIADDDIIDSVWILKGIKQQFKQLLKEEKQRTDLVAAFMGKHELLVDSCGTPLVTWRFTKEVERFDSKALEKDDPDLYAKYVKIGDKSRRFCINIK